MATIINTPNGGDNGDTSGAGMMFGVIIGIILIGILVLYGLPALRGTVQPQQMIAVPNNADITLDQQ